MGKDKDLRESCQNILESIVKERSEKVRRIKYYDYIHKFKLLNEIPILPFHQKEKYDIIILSIVPVEFNTMNDLFGVGSDKEDDDINGLWFYRFQVDRTYNRKPLKVLITLVGQAGDINCSLACSRILQKYDCDLMLLFGIAAGLRSQLTKYSTVVSQSIVNYEFQRIDEDGITFRPKIFNIDRYTAKIISKIDSDKWKSEFLKQYDKLVDNKVEFPINKLDEVVLKEGVIASGAKLLANGKHLAFLRKKIPVEKGIIAAEMEGSGFSPTCEEYGKKWLIFRGISDYGEPDKNDPLNKKYQKIAAASASVAVMYYLKFLYRTPGERGETDLIF